MPTFLKPKRCKCIVCGKPITAKGKYKYCRERCARIGDSRRAKLSKKKKTIRVNKITDDTIKSLLIRFDKDLGAALMPLKVVRSLLIEVEESRKLLKECHNVPRNEGA
jgi:predicted nucleic acid-binding Zn ribbon protein